MNVIRFCEEKRLDENHFVVLVFFRTIEIRMKKQKQNKQDNVTPILKRISLASHSKMHPPQNYLCHILVTSGNYPSLPLFSSP